MADHNPRQLFIGIDIGGTFTDFVIFDQGKGEIITSKILSTPENPALAVISGMEEALEKFSGDPNPILVSAITHGSTVATNTLLEKKGARTALVTTAGFRDVLEIGRQARTSLYDFSAQKPDPIIDRSRRFEVEERVDSQGHIIKPLQMGDLDQIATQIKLASIESVAVCLLFSFLFPEHELQIADILREQDLHVSLSSEILPEYREYERTSTTVLNAYVTPILDHYLGSLQDSLSILIPGVNLRIMQSNGGIISLAEARRAGVRCIVSGPAGGVVGASHVARSAGSRGKSPGEDHPIDPAIKLITFDMGGTSTDVSLVDQQPSISTETMVAGYPIGIPMLDIHTIGAGGGSIARVDLGGVLRVGPESAGADPGPACYALGDPSGDLPTVTDANVVLGRLPVDYFLGGKMKIDPDRSFKVMSDLGHQMGLDAIHAAHGVIEVVNAHMERALRLVTIERGHDPQDFELLSFGGAGGLHAATLARRLSIPRVIVPPLASTLSAFGMLVADVVKDYSQTVMFFGQVSVQRLRESFEPLIERGHADLRAEGFTPSESLLELSLDIRYRGQSYELQVPFDPDFLENFHQFHFKAYGYSRPQAEVEIVNLRLRAVGITSPPEIPSLPGENPDPVVAYLEDRLVYIQFQGVEVPLFRGELLSPGNLVEAPAVVVRQDTTIYLPLGSSARVDRYLNLVISFVENQAPGFTEPAGSHA